jgi:hypothetical protein
VRVHVDGGLPGNRRQAPWVIVLGANNLRRQAMFGFIVVSRIPNNANDNVELLRLGRRIQTERKILGLSQNGFAKDCLTPRSKRMMAH